MLFIFDSEVKDDEFDFPAFVVSLRSACPSLDIPEPKLTDPSPSERPR